MDKIFKGKTIDEAVKNACEALGVSEDSLFYEVVDLPAKGFLGIGSKLASIKIPGTDDPESYINDYLKELFFKMGISDYNQIVEIKDGNIVNISLEGEEIGYYTHKNTDIVDSLQFLLALSLNREFENKNYKVTLNINDYKEKTTSRLESLAVKTAKQVLRNKRKVTLRPMSAYQRRIVHSKLHEFENITTFSIGEEPNRRVVIAYDGPDRALPRDSEGKPVFEKKGSDKKTSGRKNHGGRVSEKNGLGNYGKDSFEKDNKGGAERENSGSVKISERGGGKPFDPGALGHSLSSRGRADKKENSSSSEPRVEKVKILYPGPDGENNADSDFNAE